MCMYKVDFKGVHSQVIVLAPKLMFGHKISHVSQNCLSFWKFPMHSVHLKMELGVSIQVQFFS